MAEQQQMEARANLRATVMEAATSQPADQAMEVDPDWDSMLQSWEQEQQGAYAGVLQRAMQAPTPAPSFGHPGGPTYVPDMRLPGAPAASAASAAPPPPGSLSPGPGSESTLTDPNIGTSPVHPAGPEAALHRERRTSPVHPGQRPPGAVRVPTTVEAPREGIKPATSAPNQVVHPAQEGVTLADKLAVRRSALEPFGQTRLPAPPGLASPELTEAEIAIAEARAQALNAASGVHQALANASILSDDEGEGDELT